MKFFLLIVVFIHAGCKHRTDDESTPPSKILKYCNDPRTKSIPRPISPGSADTFTYKYFLKPSSGPDSPVIVAIPGGPGQGGIASDGLLEQYLTSFPDAFGVLVTDPRGVGCNYNGDKMPGEFYSSDLVAEDIAMAIKDAKLTNYIVYGVSYGTVVSTILSAKIESLNLPKPKSVVLEGVLSRAIKPEDQTIYTSLWTEILNASPQRAIDAFKSEKYPFGDSAGWASVIASLLRLGLYESKLTYFSLLSRIIGFSVSSSSEELTKAKNIYNSINSDPDESVPGFGDFYLNIACSEIWQKVGGYKLSGGVFASSDVNYCTKYSSEVKSKQNYFDHLRYLSGANFIYFQGKKDPATPYSQAREHFTGQTKASERTWVQVERGGHNLLGISIEEGCTDGIWKGASQASPQDSIKTSLAKCHTPGLTVDYFAKTSTSVASLIINADSNTAYSLVDGIGEGALNEKALLQRIKF